MTILNDRPVKPRALSRRTLLQASSPASDGGVSPPPNSEPNFKFRELFAIAARIHPLEKTPVAPFEITQVASKEMVNKLTN